MGFSSGVFILYLSLAFHSLTHVILVLFSRLREQAIQSLSWEKEEEEEENDNNHYNIPPTS